MPWLNPFARWSLDSLGNNERIRSPELGLNDRIRNARYPLRLLRYWFVYNALVDEANRLGRPPQSPTSSWNG